MRLSNTPRSAAAVLIVIAAAIVAACSALIGADDAQCAVDADCTRRGPAFSATTCVSGLCRGADPSDAGPDVEGPIPPGPWGCLGRPPVVADAGPIVRRRLRFVDSSTVSPGVDNDRGLRAAAPVVGAELRMCSTLDVGCERPTPIEGAAFLVADADGWMDLSFPSDYLGYLDVRHPDYLRMSVFLGGRPAQLKPEYLSAMIRTATAPAIGAAIGVAFDEKAGLLSLGAHDCNGQFAPGVSFGLSPRAENAVGFYIVDGFPSTSATATGPSSAGGFANAPAGSYEASAKVAATGAQIGARRVLVRAGGHTHLTFLVK